VRDLLKKGRGRRAVRPPHSPEPALIPSIHPPIHQTNKSTTNHTTGAHYPLPDGYRAYLLQQPAGVGGDSSADPAAGSTRRTWPAAGSWPSLTAWSLDAPPGAADPARRALDWLAVAAAAAAHVDAGAVSAALAGGGSRDVAA
jgi:hypothetical protein